MNDSEWMLRALELGRAARGGTAPNPAVGAIVVRDGHVLGEGCTQPAGSDHAEVVALNAVRAAGHDAAGATIFVTLEPCCHQGRTPPCTDALIAAGIRRVVVGVSDPFPAVLGRGIAQLQDAGVEVLLGVEASACSRQILGFARSIAIGLPEVCCKAAMSADGHIATDSGESKWITGPQARADGHGLRAEYDAILVGIQTVLADDPQLNCRVPSASAEGSSLRNPRPVVLDTRLRIDAAARVFTAGARPLLICGPDAPERDLQADIVRVSVDVNGRVDIEAALRAVVDAGLHRVLVEGGGTVHRSLIDAQLVDTLQLYIAGVVVPGGRPWVGGEPIGPLGDAVRMALHDVRRLGPDVRLTYRLEHGSSPEPLVSTPRTVKNV